MQIRIDHDNTLRVSDTHSLLYLPNISDFAYQKEELVHTITDDVDTVYPLTYDSYIYHMSSTPSMGDTLITSTEAGINNDPANGIVSINLLLNNDDIIAHLDGKTQATVYCILYGIKDSVSSVLANYDLILKSVIALPPAPVEKAVVGGVIIL